MRHELIKGHQHSVAQSSPEFPKKNPISKDEIKITITPEEGCRENITIDGYVQRRDKYESCHGGGTSMFVLVGSVVWKSQGIGCGLPLLRTFGFSSNTGPKAIEDTTTTSRNIDRRYI